MISEISTDAELAAVAAADSQAFGLLYDRYVNNVYAYVASRLPCRLEAEDVTSEIWMKILRNIARFRARRSESVIAWIFAIARNAVTDAHRRRKQCIPLEDDDIVAIESSDPNPAQALDRQQQFCVMQQYIDTLPPKQAQCLRLRYYAGLRNQEIAMLEGLSEKTVSAHISRGIQTLRSHPNTSLLQFS